MARLVEGYFVSLSEVLSQRMVMANRSKKPEGLQEPYDQCDDNHHFDDLSDGRIHWNQPDEIQDQANDNERYNHAN